MNDARKTRKWLWPLLVIFLWLILFWPILVGQDSFAFRDSASFYQPLFQWTAGQWLAGQVPLWCSLDNWGAPVVADVTSSVFYPGKLVFLLPFVPYSIQFGFFTAIHVLLAIFAARWFGEIIGLSETAQWLAGISFGFGGPVLFQTCNLVFLISAAWLPLALGFVWRFYDTRQFRDLIMISITLTMMILGGDPQMACHVVLIAAVTWVFRIGSLRLFHTVVALLTIAVLVAGLSALQVLPAAEWARQSERLAEPSTTAAMIGQPQVGTHRDAIYQFSLPPWSLAEMICPGVFGKLDFATHWRWGNSIAGADRVWTGSIYIGLVVLLLAVAHLLIPGHPDRRRHDRWLASHCFFCLPRLDGTDLAGY